jgi:hypothetical protein
MFARMIAHHNGAIQMCREMRANGTNADASPRRKRSSRLPRSTLQTILDRSPGRAALTPPGRRILP